MSGAEVKMLQAMPRPSFAFSRRYLVPALLVASAIGCAPPVLDVEVKLVTKSCRPSGNPLEKAAVLRFTVFGEGINSTTSQTSATLDMNSATIPALPVGSARNIVAEAFDTGNNLVARGETGPVDFSGKQTKASVTIFLRKKDAFDYANQASSPDTACTTLAAARTGHTATLLDNGKVLIAGGYQPGTITTYLATTEIYDPQTGVITAGANLLVPRAFHTATHIPGTKFTIIAGGESNATRAEALLLGELYDESTNAFVDPPFQMTTARTRHAAAIPLAAGGSQSGIVFFFGGLDKDGKAIKSIEIFDKDNGFQATPLLIGGDSGAGRGEATAIAVPGVTNGVALFGGWAGIGGGSTQPLDVLGVSSPDGQQFGLFPGGQLTTAHMFPMVATLGDGSVVVVGGFSGQTMLDPNLNSAVGGGDVFTPDLMQKSPIPVISASNNTPLVPRAFGGAIGLKNGKVLVTGGASGMGAALNDAFIIYRDLNSSGIATATTNPMIDKRVQAAYTLLKDGTVLVTGGYNFAAGAATPAAIATVEVYQPYYVVAGDEAHQK